MSTWALVMAAGSGARMGLDTNKVLADLGGMPVLARSVHAFDGEVDGVMVVTRQVDMEDVRAMNLNARLVVGGQTRQQSVRNGLMALPPDAEYVLVHDGARPFVDQGTIRRCIASVQAYGSGVASVPVKDTIKQMGDSNTVLYTPDRASLRIAQTPQAFRVKDLMSAIEVMERNGRSATDDAGAMEASGVTVHMVDGSYANIKLTTREDLAVAQHYLNAPPMLRVGQGYDVHKLVEGRRLILCGIDVPYEKGLLGHSDADVATHALMDAILGAAGLGDIGRHFPDTDARYKDVSSIVLLEQVVATVAAKGYITGNADITIVAQRPKLMPYLEKMTAEIARVLGVSGGQVNVKATTTEGLGFEGEGLGISAHAVVLLQRNT